MRQLSYHELQKLSQEHTTATRISTQPTKPQGSFPTLHTDSVITLFHLGIFLSKRILFSRNYKFITIKMVGNFITPERSATALNYFLFSVCWWNCCCSASKYSLSIISILKLYISFPLKVVRKGSLYSKKYTCPKWES